MEKARDMNEVQITSNVQLIQENNGESTPGFVMYMPVYRPYNPHTTIEDRRKNGIGWIAATIRTGIFVRGITTEMLHDNELEVEIHDGNTLKTPIIFDNNDATVGAHFYEPKAIFQSTDVLKMFGRSWTIKIHTLPDFELHMKNNTTKVIAISGIIISLFLSIFS